jgi:hypothetical protein
MRLGWESDRDITVLDMVMLNSMPITRDWLRAARTLLRYRKTDGASLGDGLAQSRAAARVAEDAEIERRRDDTRKMFTEMLERGTAFVKWRAKKTDVPPAAVDWAKQQSDLNGVILVQMAAGGKIPRVVARFLFSPTSEEAVRKIQELKGLCKGTADFMLPYRVLRPDTKTQVTDSDRLLRVAVLLDSINNRDDLKDVLNPETKQAVTEAQRLLIRLSENQLLLHTPQVQAAMAMHGFCAIHEGCKFYVSRPDSWYDCEWWEIPVKHETALCALQSPYLVIHRASPNSKSLRVTVSK